MRTRIALFTLSAAFVAISTGCNKKVAMVTPPPAPAPAAAPAPAPEPPRQRAAVVAETPRPAPRPEPAVARHTAKSLEDLLNQLLDAYFDYDQASLRTDAQTALNKNSSALRELLKEFPDTKFLVEGNCDERGSAAYNLALGDRRAAAAKEFLTQIGVPSDRLTTISYGQERPTCTDHNEDCWQKNRRAHLTASR
jgi:peptidoglycan-associated lipoprotein